MKLPDFFEQDKKEKLKIDRINKLVEEANRHNYLEEIKHIYDGAEFVTNYNN